jgi:hypothetical protein
MATDPESADVLRLVAAVDWAAYAMPPSAEWYHPEEVPAAFEMLTAARTKEQGDAAYDAMLFAVGNNHAGLLYPAAAAAAPLVVRVARECDGWARRAALEILCELTSFSVDREQFIDPTGRVVHAKETILAEIESLRDHLEHIAAMPDPDPVPTAQSARDLLEYLGD